MVDLRSDQGLTFNGIYTRGEKNGRTEAADGSTFHRSPSYGTKTGGAVRILDRGGAIGEGFRLIDLEPDILAILTVVDTGPAPADFIYRFWGTGRFLFLGNRPDPTGRPVIDGLSELNAADVLAQYQAVYDTGRPVLMQNSWKLESGLVAECQTLRLPLAKDAGPGIGKIVAATKFLRHAEEVKRLLTDGG